MQNALTVIVPVKKDEIAPLKALLERVGGDIEGKKANKEIRLAEFPTLHFARWVLLEETEPDKFTRETFPASLVLGTDHDGPDDALLRDLHAKAAPFLAALYGRCLGAPDDLVNNADAFVRYMLANKVSTAARHIGYHHRKVTEVKEALVLREKMHDILRAHRNDAEFQTGADPVAACRKIIGLVDSSGAIQASHLPTNWLKIGFFAVLFLLVALLVALPFYSWVAWGMYVGILLLALLPFVILFSRLKKAEADEEKAFQPPTPVIAAKELLNQENQVVQNQMTHIVPIRKGDLRLTVLNVVFVAIEFVARAFSDKGELGGIPTIHFARWMIVDKGRRLLFFSNFDGSWESYLGDFVDKAHEGLTAVWSNTVGFPPAHNLIQDGATNVDVFKAWTRERQVPTQIWYSAYPEYTVRNINNALALRDGIPALRTAPSDGAAKAWLSRLNECFDEPSPAQAKLVKVERPKIDYRDVQGLIFYGYGHLRSAHFLFLMVEDKAKAQEWLGEIAGLVSDGMPERDINKRSPQVRHIAFSAPGLHALGLDETAMKTFPEEFQEGMSAPARARALGDNGISDPKRWEWGVGEKIPHIMLMLFASDADSLSEMRRAEEARRTRIGGVTVLAEQMTNELTKQEHFGFRDGISNPVPVGGPLLVSPGDRPIAAGEFILGYENAYGTFPYTPIVPSTPEAEATLPPAIRETQVGTTAVADTLKAGQQKAENDRTAPIETGGYDFGKNGTYIAYRKLQQDVAGFWNYCNAQADAPPDANAGHTPEWVASKMFGRWPSGVPIVFTPEHDNKELAVMPDPRDQTKTVDATLLTDFRFAVPHGTAPADIQGMACPIGAHTRRANPRDALTHDPEESLTISNRHRIMRRGRAYGKPHDAPRSGEEDGVERGVIFMGLVANIARQFEFVQQMWLNNPKFHGLYDSRDPISGDNDDKIPADTPTSHIPCRFAIAESPIRKMLEDVPRFVTVRAGAYFFLPGISALYYLAGKPRPAPPPTGETQ